MRAGGFESGCWIWIASAPRILPGAAESAPGGLWRLCATVLPASAGGPVPTVEALYRTLAAKFGLPFARIEDRPVSPDALQRVPARVAFEYRIFPLAWDGRRLTLATAVPLDFFTIDNLRHILGVDLECVLSMKWDVDQALHRYC